MLPQLDSTHRLTPALQKDELWRLSSRYCENYGIQALRGFRAYPVLSSTGSDLALPRKRPPICICLLRPVIYEVP